MIVSTLMLADAAWGLAFDKAADGVFATFKSKADARNASAELVEIVDTAIGAMGDALPALAEELREEEFIKGIAVPWILRLVTDPTAREEEEAFAKSFRAFHVDGQQRRADGDEILRRIFDHDDADLARGARAFFSSVRTGLHASKHWRSVAQVRTLEALSAKIAIVEANTAGLAPLPPLDRAVALQEARAGSLDLREWRRDVAGAEIVRSELQALLDRIAEAPAGETLLVGEAGSGKSALLSKLVAVLEEQGIAVFGIKADQLSRRVRRLEDLQEELGLIADPLSVISTLALGGPTVLIIDQLDAVSTLMDQRSDRMKVLLRLVDAVHPQGSDRERTAVHVVVSSRPFEADHDARFSRFDGDRLPLQLPTTEQVNRLFKGIGIDPLSLPPSLAETVRRPFALGLFVDLVKRGSMIDDLLPSELLVRWLDTADLGSPSERADVMGLLVGLAKDMMAAEALWRPVDAYRLRAKDALQRAVASGLLVVADQKVGFSHQSWLDDFQAKGFNTGRELAEFAWVGQDGLFGRATVLRTLQRFRTFDRRAYGSALDLLLGSEGTRRHLRHLTVDLISGQSEPEGREVAWLGQVVRADRALARRAVRHMAGSWPAWRAFGLEWLPSLMRDEELAWSATEFLVAEARHDVSTAFDLIERHWSTARHDRAYLRFLGESAVWNHKAAARLAALLTRDEMPRLTVIHVAKQLLDVGEMDAAVEVALLQVRALTEDRSWDVDLYEIEAIASAAPMAFARGALPTFVELASGNVEEHRRSNGDFPRSTVLPHPWREDQDGSLFAALRLALRLAAAVDPAGLADLMRPVWQVEIEQVQTLVADALTAGGSALVDEGLKFLLADTRRLDIGSASGEGEDGIGRTIQGWSSRQLVASVSSGLAEDGLASLLTAIEGWNRYSPELIASSKVADRRQLRIWAEEARMPLLEVMPERCLSARRRRQVEEWRAEQPVMKPKVNVMRMAHLVGPPMSAESMERATDEQIMGMLDERHDRAG